MSIILVCYVHYLLLCFTHYLVACYVIIRWSVRSIILLPVLLACNVNDQ